MRKLFLLFVFVLFVLIYAPHIALADDPGPATTVIPEPISASLFLLGSGALVAAKKIRNRK